MNKTLWRVAVSVNSVMPHLESSPELFRVPPRSPLWTLLSAEASLTQAPPPTLCLSHVSGYPHLTFRLCWSHFQLWRLWGTHCRRNHHTLKAKPLFSPRELPSRPPTPGPDNTLLLTTQWPLLVHPFTVSQHLDSHLVLADVLCKHLSRGPFLSILTITHLVRPSSLSSWIWTLFHLTSLTAGPITFHPLYKPCPQVNLP